METSEIVLLFLLSTTPLPRYSFHLASTRDLRLEVSNHFEALKGCSSVKIRKQKNILSERLGIFHWLQRLNLGPINGNFNKEGIICRKKLFQLGSQ